MATLTLHGLPARSSVRTARMTCAEKGVDHHLIPVEPGSAHHRSLHPFANMPVLQHGEVELYETQAIIRYLDATFAGNPLVPSEPRALGTMEQWISVHSCYLHRPLLDDDLAAPRVSMIDRCLGLLERTLRGRPWVAGCFSLADLLLAPVITTLASRAETRGLVGRRMNVGRWLRAMEQRPSGPLLHPPRTIPSPAARGPLR